MEEEDTTAGCVILTLTVSQPVTAVSTWAASEVCLLVLYLFIFIWNFSIPMSQTLLLSLSSTLAGACSSVGFGNGHNSNFENNYTVRKARFHSLNVYILLRTATLSSLRIVKLTKLYNCQIFDTFKTYIFI